jgi:hypothetical protein
VGGGKGRETCINLRELVGSLTEMFCVRLVLREGKSVRVGRQCFRVRAAVCDHGTKNTKHSHLSKKKTATKNPVFAKSQNGENQAHFHVEI